MEEVKKQTKLEEVKQQTKEFETEISRINDDTAYREIQNEIIRAETRIARYEEELANLNTNSMTHIEAIRAKTELEEAIQLAKVGSKKMEEIKHAKEGDYGQVEGLDELNKRKEEIEKSRTSDGKKREMSSIRDKRGAYYTQTKNALDLEARTVKHEMEGLLLQMETFKYEKDEQGRVTNGAEFGKLDKRYKELTDQLTDLRAAIKECDIQKQKVQAEWEEAVKPMQEALRRKPEQKTEKEEQPKGGNEQTQEEENKTEKPKQEDPSKTEKKGDKSKELPVIDGKGLYGYLRIGERYHVKMAAYARSEGIDESQIGLLRKIRLFLPNGKYRQMAEEGISRNDIDIPENILKSYKEDQALEQEEPKQESKQQEEKQESSYEKWYKNLSEEQRKIVDKVNEESRKAAEQKSDPSKQEKAEKTNEEPTK